MTYQKIGVEVIGDTVACNPDLTKSASGVLLGWLAETRFSPSIEAGNGRGAG